MGEAARDLILFVGVMFVLFLVWIFTGGPSRSVSQSGPFINPPAPLGNGQPYGAGIQLPYVPVAPSSKFEEQVQSSGKIIIEQGNARNAQTADGEYIVAVNPQGAPASVPITGLSLSDASGAKGTIGLGSAVPYAGKINDQTPITLAPGDIAYIDSGRSPIGVSFRVNKCSGYLGQFQTFTPPLSHMCPYAEQDLPNVLRGTACESYVATIPQCTINLNAPSNLPAACVQFIQNQASYNGCVDLHKNDSDFYRPEWRVYLGSQTTLWQSSTLIRIRDSAKKIIGSFRF